MTLPHPIRAVGPILALVLGAAALVGCTPDGAATPSTSPDAQSITEACATVRDTVTGAVDRLGAVDVGDPAASVDALADMADRLGAAASAVEDTDLGAVLPDLQHGFGAAADAVRGLAAGDLAQLPALQRATGDIQSAFGRFSALCADR